MSANFLGIYIMALVTGVLCLAIWIAILRRRIAAYRRAHAQYRKMLAEANFHLTTPSKWHDLKCHPPYFDQVYRGLKTFDVRVYDRQFLPGDGIRLREFTPTNSQYTGRMVCVYVMAVYDSLIGVKDRHVALSIRLIAPPLD